MLSRVSRGGRTYTYATLMGSIVATLLLGLVVPFALGSPASERSTDRRALDEVSDLSGDEPTTPATAPDSDATDRPDPASSGTAPNDAENAGGGSAPSEGGSNDNQAGDATTSTDAPGAPSSGSASSRTASDVGVTPDAVKVAFFTARFSELAKAGYGLDLGDEEGAYQGFIDQVNAGGGVHGRTIEPVFIPFDPADADDRRRACLVATEDHEVFATVNLVGMFGAGALCVAEEHDRPLLAYLGESDSLHARSQGRYVSFQMSKNDSLVSMALEADRLGLLAGRTIGVLDSEFPSDKEASEQGLLSTLDSLGHEVTHRHTSATNIAEAQAQIPIAVSEMQRKGVDVIFLASNFVAVQSFVNQAGSRNFYPQYLASDFGQIATDTATSGFDGSSFDGAIAFSMLRLHGFKAGLQPNEIERTCAERHRSGTGTSYEVKEALYSITIVQCGLVDTLVQALEAAGTEPTRDRYSTAQLSFGSFRIGTLHPMSWGRDKYTGGDYLWTVQWQADGGCPAGSGDGCWYPIDEVRPRPT